MLSPSMLTLTPLISSIIFLLLKTLAATLDLEVDKVDGSFKGNIRFFQPIKIYLQFILNPSHFKSI